MVTYCQVVEDFSFDRGLLMSKAYHQRLAKIKVRYPRAYEQWAEDDETLLAEMFHAGHTVDEMSAALQRQPSAIQGRLRKRNFTTPSTSISLPSNEVPQPEISLIDQVPVTSDPITVQFSFQWHSVMSNVTEPYCYPQPITPYMRHRYRWPAVYRWLICADDGSKPALMYIGTTKKLCPDRLNGYLQPEGNTNQRLAGLFHEYGREGYTIYLETLGKCDVQAGAEIQTPYHLRSQARRLVLEELLIDYYKQQGYELLNQ